MLAVVTIRVQVQQFWLDSGGFCTKEWYTPTMKTVTAAYARAHLPELLNAASRGERITIARHRKAVAELGPSPKAQRPVPILGGVKGIKILDPHWSDPMTEKEIAKMLEDRY